MAALKVTKSDFQREVLESDKTVLVDFWADGCAPCRMVSPIMDEIAGERADIKVCKVNVGEEQELASDYRIMGVPALMVIKNGKVVKQSVGAREKEQILAMLS